MNEQFNIETKCIQSGLEPKKRRAEDSSDLPEYDV